MKSRYDIHYSLSVLELSRITKSINESRKIEAVKPYRMFINMRKLYFATAGIAIFLLFLSAVTLIFKTDNDVNNVITRLRNANIFSFILLGASLAMLSITEKLEQFFMKKNEGKEQNSQENIRHLKINRYYLEEIGKFGSSKIFWSFIKRAYINKEFMFIQTYDNTYLVFPARALTSEEEFQQLFIFITGQIHNHSK